jgi:alpha-N-acetylgalactosaminidase
MGAALEASGRDIVYSCSWPAYIGDNESTKPFNTFIMDGCNLWRNWDDIQCDWGSLSSIIDHWGDYGSVLAPWAGPGHWHDADMLLIGLFIIIMTFFSFLPTRIFFSTINFYYYYFFSYPR